MFTQRVVLITGASSGVGQAAAGRFAREARYRVYGTSRDPERAPAIPGVEMVPLDVRADESVAACVRSILERAGRLDVLINNAGYELAGSAEETSLEETRTQFETNFFGVVRMANAVLPTMRRQGSGHIINVGSLSGLTPIPFMSMYSATKFALEGYTEALRHELKPFNIRVSIVEPGFLKTAMMKNRQVSAHPLPAYDIWRERGLRAIRAFEATAPGPESVAHVLLDIVESSNPRLRYPVGSQARVTLRLKRFLPAGAFEQGARRTFGLDRERP